MCGANHRKRCTGCRAQTGIRSLTGTKKHPAVYHRYVSRIPLVCEDNRESNSPLKVARVVHHSSIGSPMPGIPFTSPSRNYRIGSPPHGGRGQGRGKIGSGLSPRSGPLPQCAESDPPSMNRQQRPGGLGRNFRISSLTSILGERSAGFKNRNCRWGINQGKPATRAATIRSADLIYCDPYASISPYRGGPEPCYPGAKRKRRSNRTSPRNESYSTQSIRSFNSGFCLLVRAAPKTKSAANRFFLYPASGGWYTNFKVESSTTEMRKRIPSSSRQCF